MRPPSNTDPIPTRLCSAPAPSLTSCRLLTHASPDHPNPEVCLSLIALSLSVLTLTGLAFGLLDWALLALAALLFWVQPIPMLVVLAVGLTVWLFNHRRR